MREMTLQDIQQVSLDILKEVHNFCVENNIKYTLQGGTLLGAIRHKGFIPWDDDIDISMPRPDYERFIRTYKSYGAYKLFSREHIVNNNVYIAYARVCEMEKTYVDNSNLKWNEENTGVWVDIFPLDGIEKCITEREQHIKQIKHIWRIIKIWRFSKSPFKRNALFKTKLRWLLYQVIAPFINCSKEVDKLIALCKVVPYGETDVYIQAAYPAYGLKECHKIAVLNEVIMVQFEDTRFNAMKGFSEALYEKYGSFMQLPPLEQRKPGHGGKYYWIE